MIGFYDYTVLLTYLSLISSIFGMTQAIEGHFRIAIVCLAFCGLCDMFDGKVARSKQGRTDDEKLFGVQIDSLCDLVCFGVFPIMICYLLGVRTPFGLLLLSFYGICSVIRLAFFNVLETNRQRTEDGANKYYHGLPITSIAVILPLLFLLSFLFSSFVFIIILHVMLFVVGTLFVYDFKLKKPGNKTLALLVVIVAVAVIVIFLFSKFKVKKQQIDNTPIIDKIESQFNDDNQDNIKETSSTDLNDKMELSTTTK